MNGCKLLWFVWLPRKKEASEASCSNCIMTYCLNDGWMNGCGQTRKKFLKAAEAEASAAVLASALDAIHSTISSQFYLVYVHM